MSRSVPGLYPLEAVATRRTKDTANSPGGKVAPSRSPLPHACREEGAEEAGKGGGQRGGGRSRRDPRLCAGVKGERTKRRSPGNEAGKRRFRLSDVPRQSQRRTRETSRVTRASGSTEDAHSVTACAPTQRVEVAVREETSFVLCGDTRARPRSASHGRGSLGILPLRGKRCSCSAGSAAGAGRQNPHPLGSGARHPHLIPEGCICPICQGGNNGFDKWVFTRGYIPPAWAMASWGPIPIPGSSEPPFGFYMKSPDCVLSFNNIFCNN